MKLRTTAVLSLLLVSSVANAEWSANLGFQSDYYFRGILQKSSSASGGIDFTHNGFYAGVWGADVGELTGDGLLITTNPHDDALRGVEVRTPRVELTTLSRLDDRTGRVPVSGWDTRLQSVSTHLYLPPGTRLLYAAGADRDVDLRQLEQQAVVLAVEVDGPLEQL